MWDWIKRYGKNNQSEALILMYHRVSSPQFDPWKLSVSPANFEEQLQYLKSNHTLIGLDELSLALKKGVKNPIAISFDDGYADNYLEARPLLEAFNVPASFFICTGNIVSGELFWWDKLQHILLNNPVLPQQLSMPALNNFPVFDLADEEILSPGLAAQISRWASPQPPPGKRCMAFMAIWKELKIMPSDKQKAILFSLQAWAGLQSTNQENDRAMTVSELKLLAANSLFSIGAHSVSHPPLSLCSTELQKKEIEESREYLEKLTGRSINTFAYPFGDYNIKTCEILKSGKFTIGLTTDDSMINYKTNPFKWGRYKVENMTCNEFEQAIKNQLKRA